MGNAELLVPEVMSLNDWIEAGIKVESFMKSDEGIRKEDPLAEVRSWLNGESHRGIN